MKAEVSKSIVFKERDNIKPIYYFQEIKPRDGATSCTITVSSKVEINFLIPPDVVFNFSKSRLCFSAAFEGQVDATDPEEPIPLYNFTYLNTIPYFDNVELSIRDGTVMYRLPFHSRVNAILNRACTPSSKIQSNTTSSGGLRIVNNEGTAERFDGTDVTTRWNEMAYYEAGDSALPNALSIDFKILLSEIGKESILELDKDLYFGRQVELKLRFNTSDLIAWTTPTQNDPADTVQEFTQNISITGLKLMLAVERDKDISNSIKQQVNSTGLTLLVPYPIIVNKPFPDTITQQAISTTLDRTHGHSLLKVYSSFFVPTLDPNHQYESSILENIITGYRSAIDDQYLQNTSVTVENSYIYNYDSIYKGVLFSTNEYQYNFFHVDDFTGKVGEQRTKIYEDNLLTGLPITEKKLKYQFEATSDGTNYMEWYNIFICQRTMKIDSTGVTFI